MCVFHFRVQIPVEQGTVQFFNEVNGEEGGAPEDKILCLP